MLFLISYQDSHSQGWCTNTSCWSWVGFRLDTVCVLFMISVVAGAFYVKLDAGKFECKLLRKVLFFVAFSSRNLEQKRECSQSIFSYASFVYRYKCCAQLYIVLNAAEVKSRSSSAPFRATTRVCFRAFVFCFPFLLREQSTKSLHSLLDGYFIRLSSTF